MSSEFIFVYGTLCKTSGTTMSHVLARYSEYVSLAFMQGILYEVDGYLGVIESNNPNDKVYGELHKILDSEPLLPLLDEYEECTEQFPQPHEYIRKLLSIMLTNGDYRTAWVYVYNRDVSTLQRIIQAKNHPPA